MNNRWLKERIQAARDKQPTYVLKNAHVANVFTGETRLGDVALYQDTILGVGEYDCENTYDCNGAYLCPGFIDAHAHVESSLAVPWEYARAVLSQGTTMVVADPQGIANVLGLDGVRFMVRGTEKAGLEIYYMFPAGVPVRPFEQNNASLGPKEAAQLVWEGAVYGLGELKDYDAVLDAQDDMMRTIALFDGRMIDGYAPGITGDDLNAYAMAGAATDHECVSLDEVREKLGAGLRIQLCAEAEGDVSGLMRELAQSGLPLDRVMFCSGGRHLYSIAEYGHINYNARLAVQAGIPPIDAVRMATINAATAYRLPGRGAIAPGYYADLALFRDMERFEPVEVFVMGRQLCDVEIHPIAQDDMLTGNSVNMPVLKQSSFELYVAQAEPVMEMKPGSVRTVLTVEHVPQESGVFIAADGYAKIAAIERHRATGSLGIGVVKGFGLERGAIATTVSHDSHNIVVVGLDDADMLLAVQHLKETAGGYALACDGRILAELPLPIAGLMSAQPYRELLHRQEQLLARLHELGVPADIDPLHTLSFYALPVLPDVRITTYGLYDVVHGIFLDGVKR